MIAKQLIVVALVAVSGVATAGNQGSRHVDAKLPRFAVRGSWNGITILTTLIQQYGSDRQTHVIDFMPADTDQIPGLLLHHACDVGMALDSRLPEKAKESADRFENMTLGWFVVCVAVNAKSPVRTITLDDLRGVFAGKVLLWQDVRGSGATGRIEAFHAAAFCTQGMLFQKKVLLGQRYVDRPLTPATFPRSGKKSDAKAGAGKEGEAAAGAAPRREKETDAGVIGAVIKQPNAIGFILYPCDGRLDKRIRILGIVPSKGARSVCPSTATIADGSYPLVDSLTLYLHPAAPAEAKKFCKFAAGPQGAKSVKQFGLWPECELEGVRLTQNLAHVKKGRGTEITVCDLASSARLLNDLVSEFMKVKTAVRLDVQKEGAQAEEEQRILEGSGELLLVNQSLATKGWVVADRGQENTALVSATSDGTRERQDRLVPDASGKYKPPRLQSPPVVPIGFQDESKKDGQTGDGHSPTNRSLGRASSAIGPSSPLLLPTLRYRVVAKTPRAEEESPSPRAVVLGRMVVGIVVHPKNVLDALPLDELRGILCGEITRWPGANGEAGTMHVYGLQSTDAIARLFKEKVGEGAMKGTALPDTQKVIAEVSRDQNAIGYVDLSQLSPDEKSVKLVDVYLPGQSRRTDTHAKERTIAKAEGGNRKPAKTVSNKSPAATSSSPAPASHHLTSLAAYHLPDDYPLARTFTLCVSPKASQTTRDFAKFVASDRCAETLLKHNLLPPLYCDAHSGTPAPEKPRKPVFESKR